MYELCVCMSLDAWTLCMFSFCWTWCMLLNIDYVFFQKLYANCVFFYKLNADYVIYPTMKGELTSARQSIVVMSVLTSSCPSLLRAIVAMSVLMSSRLSLLGATIATTFSARCYWATTITMSRLLIATMTYDLLLQWLFVVVLEPFTFKHSW
jgi:hypothetical protein